MKAMVRGRQQSAPLSLGADGTIRCQGAWTLRRLDELEREVEAFPWPEADEVVCEASGIADMDTGGAVLLQRILNSLEREGRHVTVHGLRPEFSGLLELVSQSRTVGESGPATPAPSWLAMLGRLTWTRIDQGLCGLEFLGESMMAFLRSVLAPRTIRWRAFLASLQRDGFEALPIIGLLTFLMGVVIAYQGAEQLRTFGANIFVVDLVGIALLREIAPLVTAILVAGRSGSAYAAQIGTMKVTEELDALRTLGISPMNLLVLPRVLALIVALPLLTVFADGIGVFGGMLIASSELQVSFPEFISRFEEAVALRHFLIGVGKAPVFAVIIGLVGCYQGFQIRGGVDDVGRHTTISVVQSIFLVIVFDAFFSVVLSWWEL